MSTWLITGCSTGLGRALAARRARRAATTLSSPPGTSATVRDLADSHPDTALPLGP